MKKFVVSLAQNPWVLWLFKVSRDSALSYTGAYGFTPSKAWAIGLGAAILSGILHAGEAYLTSAQTPSAPAVPGSTKAGLFLLAFLATASVGSAQVTEQKGWGVNPNLNLPIQFAENAAGDFIQLPVIGIMGEIGYKDVITANGIETVKYGVSLVAGGDIGPHSQTQNQITDGVVGLKLEYMNMGLIGSYQLLGSPLSGPDGSRWIIGWAYDFASLIGWKFF